MVRRISFTFLFVIAANALPGSTALAGGFCSFHSDGGQVAFSDEATDTVVMKDNCFVSTVVRVQPGESVTWINKDSVIHGVGGVANSFGELHTEMGPGDRIAYTFDDEGVFPYLCIFHPGMGGAVVVGDGLGTLTAASTVTDDGGSRAVADTVDRSQAGGNSVPLVFALGIALVLLLAATVSLARRARQGEGARQQI